MVQLNCAVKTKRGTYEVSEKDIINKQTTAGLTKDELWEIEENNKSRHQKIVEFIISYSMFCYSSS